MRLRLMLQMLALLPLTAAAQAVSGCGTLPAGLSPHAAAGRPLAWQGDFNRDGLPDRAELVSIAPGFRPAPGMQLANPWDKRPPTLRAGGEPLALLVTHDAKEGACRRFLLVHRDFFATPLWSAFAAGAPAVSLAAAGTPAHADWRRQARALRGDGIVLATEAGIDILLYWKGNGYVVFWPDEEP